MASNQPQPREQQRAAVPNRNRNRDVLNYISRNMRAARQTGLNFPDMGSSNWGYQADISQPSSSNYRLSSQAWADGSVMGQIGGNLRGMGSSDLVIQANIGGSNMFDSSLSSQVQDISMQQHQPSQPRPASVQPYQCPQPQCQNQYQNPMHPADTGYAEGHLPWPSPSPLHSIYEASQSGSLMDFDYGSRQGGSQIQVDGPPLMQLGPSYVDQQQQLSGPLPLPGQMDSGGQPPFPAQVPNEVDMQALGQLQPPQKAGQPINPPSTQMQLLPQVSQQQPRPPSMQVDGSPWMLSYQSDVAGQQQLPGPPPPPLPGQVGPGGQPPFATQVDRMYLFEKQVLASVFRFRIEEDVAERFFPNVVAGEVKMVTIVDTEGKLWFMNYTLENGRYLRTI